MSCKYCMRRDCKGDQCKIVYFCFQWDAKLMWDDEGLWKDWYPKEASSEFWICEWLAKNDILDTACQACGFQPIVWVCDTCSFKNYSQDDVCIVWQTKREIKKKHCENWGREVQVEGQCFMCRRWIHDGPLKTKVKKRPWRCLHWLQNNVDSGNKQWGWWKKPREPSKFTCFGAVSKPLTEPVKWLSCEYYYFPDDYSRPFCQVWAESRCIICTKKFYSYGDPKCDRCYEKAEQIQAEADEKLEKASSHKTSDYIQHRQPVTEVDVPEASRYMF